MRVISETAIRRFREKHPEAAEPFRRWVREARREEWRNWAELKATFPSTDLHGKCVIFNVGGNHYRVVAFIRYSHPLDDGRWSMGRVFIRHVLTHAEYDRGKWKDGCEG